MIQIKIFSEWGSGDSDELQDNVNKFLQENQSLKIIDIKVNDVLNQDDWNQSVTVVYEKGAK